MLVKTVKIKPFYIGVLITALLFSSLLAAKENNNTTQTALNPRVKDKTLTEQDIKPETFISDGMRISLEKKKFSIVPPAGWEVHKGVEGITLLMQIPYQPGVYQRTIKVLYGQEALAMDEYTLDRYAEIIVERSAKASMGIQDYRIRNKLPFELKNGSKALLYYTEFNFDQTPMMELHILTSNTEGHFVLIYTDIAENFVTDEGKKHLDIAYESMISTEIEGEQPTRFDFVYTVLGGIAILVGIAFLFLFIRKLKSSSYSIDSEPFEEETLQISDEADIDEEYMDSEYNFDKNKKTTHQKTLKTEHSILKTSTEFDQLEDDSNEDGLESISNISEAIEEDSWIDANKNIPKAG